VVVLKIGGSLFVQPQFVLRLQAFVERLLIAHAPAHIVLIAGGGPLVDALREIDHVNQIPIEHSHGAAIEMMDASADLLQAWWPQLHATSCWGDLQTRCSNGGITLFRAANFLRGLEPNLPGTRLPEGWDVTSDSIAARVAELLSAGRLILLKSPGVSTVTNWEVAASAGVVDRFFPTICASLGVVEMRFLPYLYHPT
jgi:aspartokinase-like uncharacterized kinase